MFPFDSVQQQDEPLFECPRCRDRSIDLDPRLDHQHLECPRCHQWYCSIAMIPGMAWAALEISEEHALEMKERLAEENLQRRRAAKAMSN